MTAVVVFLTTRKTADWLDNVICVLCDSIDRPGFSTFSEKQSRWTAVCFDCIKQLNKGVKIIEEDHLDLDKKESLIHPVLGKADSL